LNSELYKVLHLRFTFPEVIRMGTKLGGYMGKVLEVDLTRQETSEYPWTDEDRALYLGGKIMAARIVYDNTAADTEPLSPANYLVVSTARFPARARPLQAGSTSRRSRR